MSGFNGNGYKLWQQMLLAASAAVIGSAVPLLIAALMFASDWGALNQSVRDTADAMQELRKEVRNSNIGGLRESNTAAHNRLDGHEARLLNLERR